MRYLLDKGAQINARKWEHDSRIFGPGRFIGFGGTALHYAASHGRTAAVQLLLEQGARTDIKDREGQTVVQRAEGNGHEETADILRRHIYLTECRLQ